MRRCLSLLAIVALAAPAAEATSYVMVSDGHLVDQTPTIARVRVLDHGTTGTDARTVYRAAVIDTLKGAPGPEIEVSVPGGKNADGLTWHVYGAPRFAAGDEALLFLDWRADGTYGIQQLMLGAFHERRLGGERLAFRNLSEATELGRAPGTTTEPARGLDAFADWIRDRVAGVERDPDYLVEPSRADLAAVYDEFTLINNPGIRFFEFDTGGKVTWFLNPNGTGIPENAFRPALNAWNAESKTPINLVYGGMNTATAGLDSFDGINTAVGGDPRNEMSGSFSCGSGGVLAIGGPWFDDAIPLKDFNGEKYHRAAGADISANDGAECHLADPTKGAEVFTHELGHTLGLGHSCGDNSSPSCGSSAVLDDATMRASAHFDGRGAAIRQDDIGGIRKLYRLDTGGGGGNPPADPTALAATAVSTNQASLKWTDNATNETGYAIEMKIVGGVLSTLVSDSAPAEGTFTQVDTVGPNATTYTQTLLLPAHRYVFRVRALGSGGNNSGYSNELDLVTDTVPGTCVQDATTLCLEGDRYAVLSTWESKNDAGLGFAVELTDNTGYFWFFGADNVEVVIKVLDACKLPAFQSFWVFASGLTDQGVEIVVIDTETGKIRVYENQLGVGFKLIKDLQAFKTCDA